jgi:uncharacterized protein (TIGR00369 family)
MKTLNPDFIAELFRRINACPFFELLSMRLEELSWGVSLVTVEAAEKHLQPYGIVHGGVAAALIDAACFWAAYSKTPEKSSLTTVDLKLNYLAPVVSGKIFARGACVKLGRQLGLSTATVTEGAGKIIAHGASTLMVIEGHGLDGGDPEAVKYVQP